MQKLQRDLEGRLRTFYSVFDPVSPAPLVFGITHSGFCLTQISLCCTLTSICTCFLTVEYENGV